MQAPEASGNTGDWIVAHARAIVRLMAGILQGTAWFLILVWLLLAHVAQAAPAGEAAGPAAPRVLVLQSYHVGLPWNDALQRGLQSGLGEQAERMQLYYEHLDALRTDAQTAERFAHHITERYRKLGLDYLLATDDPAYRLLLSIRERIAPGKPILFAGVNNITPEQLAGIDAVAGIAETPDFAANLALMHQLHPQRDALVVIGDSTPTFASNLATLQTHNAAQSAPFRLSVMAPATLDELRSKLTDIPSDALIFLMGRPRDSLGNLVSGPAVARFTRGHTHQPIYVGWDFFMGHGVVGGMLVSGDAQGQALAGLLLRLAQGQALATLAPVSSSPNHYAFDHAQLQRFGIPVSALPTPAHIINRPVPIWATHPMLFFAAVSVFVLLVMLMGFLIYVMLIKRRAEAALRSLNQNLETRVAERTAQLGRANAELERTIDTLSLAQDEITRQERFASLGSMVAGVAHELNTPIGNSLVVATTLEHDTAHFVQAVSNGAVRRSTLQDYTERCTQAASMLVRSLQRAAQLVRNFKDVAVDQTSDRRRRFTLVSCAAEIVQTFEAAARGTHPQIVIDVAPDIELDSYPGALGQTFINLLENARIHAFADTAMGQVRIAAALLDSGTVRINFGDNGVGMAASDLPRIFDPFFTTRLGQGGSGLGLSIVYRLVTQTLGGRISVSSDTGRGAMFIIDLPLVAPAQPQDDPGPLPRPAALPGDDTGAPPLYLRDNLLDIRELVEANAASLAASNASDTDRQRLRRTFDALDAAFATDDMETQIQRDLAFHMGIIEATHDAALRKVGNAVLQLMYGHIRRNLSTLSPNPDRRAALRRQHQAIFEAIMQGNPEAASAAAGDHMRYVRTEGKLPLVGENGEGPAAGAP